MTTRECAPDDIHMRNDPYSLKIYGMCKNKLIGQDIGKLSYYRLRMRSVRRGHFPPPDKDGGHAIGSAISQNPTIYANLIAPSFKEPELWAIEV